MSKSLEQNNKNWTIDGANIPQIILDSLESIFSTYNGKTINFYATALEKIIVTPGTIIPKEVSDILQSNGMTLSEAKENEISVLLASRVNQSMELKVEFTESDYIGNTQHNDDSL